MKYFSKITIKIRLILLVVLILQAIILIKTSSSTTSSVRCDDRVIDPDSKLTSWEKNKLCSLLKSHKYKIFFIRIVSDLEIVSDRSNNKKYDDDIDNYSKSICEKFNSKCSEILGVTVYYDARKVRVLARGGLASRIDDEFRNKMISNMTPYLKKSQYFNAFETSINMADYKYNIFDIFVLFILICLFLTPAMFPMFFTIFRYIKSKKIHVHFSKLNDMIGIINSKRKKTPKYITTSNCLLCMDTLKNTVDDESSSIDPVVMFSCGHYYHIECISNMKNKNKADEHCLMCDNRSRVVSYFTNLSESNNCEFIQQVSKKNIFNLIEEFVNIHHYLGLYYMNYKDSDSKIMNSYPVPISWANEKYFSDEDKKFLSNSSDSDYEFSSCGGDSDGISGGDY